MKKILVLTSTFPRWKNDTDPPFVFDLSKRLTTQYKVYVLAPHAAGAPCHDQIEGLEVYRFRYAPEFFEKLAYNGGILTNIKRNPIKFLLLVPFVISELIYTCRLTRLHDIDIIHAHWIIPQGLVATCIKYLCKKDLSVLCTAHGADVYTQKSKLFTNLKRSVLNRCDGITVVSSAMKSFVAALGITRPVHVMPMGTNLSEQFTPGTEGGRKDQLVFVGRLVEKKGVSYLLEAFQQIVNEFPAITLLVIGEGPEKKALFELADNLGIRASVEFKGGLHHSEIPVYYQSSKIAIFPFITTNYGDQEGFGLVLVEAMGCQCCVIATDIATIRDIVRPGVTGLVVEEKNPRAIRDAVAGLMNDPELRIRLARAGRQHVTERFDWEHVAACYAALINEITHK